MKQSTRRQKKQKGSILVLIAAGMVSLLGAASLAVDISSFLVIRNQLQNAVDAAAIAGAQGLIVDPGNYASDGQAQKWATRIASQNEANGQPVTLSSGEITFPDSKTVRVEVTRPAPTYFARIWGVQSVNVRVVAAALIVPAKSVGPVGGDGGMRPWAVFDQFGHGSLCVGPNDKDVNSPAHGEFKTDPHTWNGVTVQTDHYVSPYDPSLDGMNLGLEGDCGMVTGLIAPRDVDGQRIYLKDFKKGDSAWRTPGNFGPIALGGSGSSLYVQNIISGYNGTIDIGDVLETEPGNEVMPTNSAVSTLISRDPTAHMVRTSSGNWIVMSDRYPVNESPRIVPIPVYSYYYAPGNGRSDFGVANIVSFFVEGSNGKDVWGKFVQTRAKKAAPGSVVSSGNGAGGRMISTVQLVTPE